MMEFNEGLPPAKKGHYWLMLRNTDEHPIPGNHCQGTHGWKCGCHPDEIQGLSDRVEANLSLGLVEISGWILLPDPSI